MPAFSITIQLNAKRGKRKLTDFHTKKEIIYRGTYILKPLKSEETTILIILLIISGKPH